MKGFGTNEAALTKVLAHLGPLEIASTKAAYEQRHRRNLLKDVQSETSNCYKTTLSGLVRGPLEEDCHVLHESIQGLGTKESAMNEVLLSRSNADLNAIKHEYQRLYKRTVEADVRADLSMKTERLFDMVMAARRAEDSAPVIPQQIDGDVREIYRATEGQQGTDELTVCSILTSRSDGQIRAISQAYHSTYQRKLDDCIRREFSGHMQQALLHIIHHAEDPAKHDADELEDAMKGMGTKDKALIRRVTRIHWDPQRLHQCIAAYRHFYKTDLIQRVRSETSGDYAKALVACLGGH